METPLCDMCGERPATVYIQIVGVDVHQERWLCPHCAAAHDVDLLPFTFDISPEGDIDISLRHSDLLPAPAQPRELPDERCGNCDTTSGDVASKGLVGCPKCYDNLPQTVARLVATVQPGAATPATTRRHEPGARLSPLARLQLELAEAVGNEDYERAARVRDEIRALRAQSGTEHVGEQ